MIAMIVTGYLKIAKSANQNNALLSHVGTSVEYVSHRRNNSTDHVSLIFFKGISLRHHLVHLPNNSFLKMNFAFNLSIWPFF